MSANLLRLAKTVSVVWIGFSSVTPGYVVAMEKADNLERLLNQQQINTQLITSPVKAFEAPDNGGPDMSLDSGTRNRR